MLSRVTQRDPIAYLGVAAAAQAQGHPAAKFALRGMPGIVEVPRPQRGEFVVVGGVGGVTVGGSDARCGGCWRWKPSSGGEGGAMVLLL